MKLVRYGAAGREKPGIIDEEGGIRDLSGLVPDIAGETLSPSGLAKIAKAKLNKLPAVPGKPRIGPCVGRVGNFIAIGLNYADHAAEAGLPVPKEPIIFNKAPSCICGPNDDTMMPKGSSKLDYEVELGVVIGSRARYLMKSKAMDAVAGYCLANDVSEREFQIERSGQWTKGKSGETFGPLGPWLVTKDEIPKAAKARYVAHGQRRNSAAGFDQDHDLQRRPPRVVLLAIHGAGAGRRHHHRHPAGRRAGHETRAEILKARDVVKLGIAGLGEQTLDGGAV